MGIRTKSCFILLPVANGEVGERKCAGGEEPSAPEPAHTPVRKSKAPAPGPGWSERGAVPDPPFCFSRSTKIYTPGRKEQGEPMTPRRTPARFGL